MMGLKPTTLVPRSCDGEWFAVRSDPPGPLGKPAPAASDRASGPQVREYGEYASVLGTDVETQFQKDLLHVRLNRSLCDEQAGCDRLVRESLATRPRTSRSRTVSSARGSTRRCRPTSCETIVGSITASPSATRLRA